MGKDCVHHTPDSGAPALTGIRFDALSSIVQVMSDAQDGGAWFISDVGLGAWRGHQIATELYGQLGIAMPAMGDPPAGAGSSNDGVPSYADIIGAGIDTEARGDRTTMEALTLASTLADALGDGPARTILVIAPRFGLGWEMENQLFVGFLARALAGTPHRVLLAAMAGEEPIVPEEWSVVWSDLPRSERADVSAGLLGLVPGIVEPDVVGALSASHAPEGTVLQIANGRLLVAPEARPRPGEVPKVRYDQLAASARPFGWLEAYAQFHGNNHYLDPMFLCAQAWSRFGEGSCGIALRLMERVIGCARTPLQKGMFTSQAQGMRIALQRFAEVAEAPDPSPAISPMLRGFLLQAKGWGLAMSGQTVRAESYLRDARELLCANSEQREFLYLLNISAFNRMKSGDLSGALTMEKEIESGAARQPERDWRLEYVNSINIARLYRRMGDVESADRYYRRAFATTLGVRSESDLIYTNVCLAQLNGARDSNEAAFVNWLRAAIHWCAAGAPEALGPRTASAILGRTASPAEFTTEQIAAAFIDLLSDAAGRLSTAMAPYTQRERESGPIPAFVRLDRFEASNQGEKLIHAVGMPGWCVLPSNVRMRERSSGPNNRRLRALVHALLGAISPVDTLTDAATIVVDDRFGREMPVTSHEALETCLRLRIPTMTFGREIAELNWSDAPCPEMLLHVRLGSAVDRIDTVGDGARVTFKRYLSPAGVGSTERAILERLDERPSVEELAGRLGGPGSLSEFVEALRALERARIINLYLLELPDAFKRMVSDCV